MSQEKPRNGYQLDDDREPWEKRMEEIGWPILRWVGIAFTAWWIWAYCHPFDVNRYIDDVIQRGNVSTIVVYLVLPGG